MSVDTITEAIAPSIPFNDVAEDAWYYEVSNIDYFGMPIYTYSLKQAIDDGFLFWF